MYPASYNVPPQYDPMQIIRIFFYGVVLGLLLAFMFFIKFPNSFSGESSQPNVHFRVGDSQQQARPQTRREQQLETPHETVSNVLVGKQSVEHTHQHSPVASPANEVESRYKSIVTDALSSSIVQITWFLFTTSTSALATISAAVTVPLPFLTIRRV